MKYTKIPSPAELKVGDVPKETQNNYFNRYTKTLRKWKLLRGGCTNAMQFSFHVNVNRLNDARSEPEIIVSHHFEDSLYMNLLKNNLVLLKTNILIIFAP